MFIVEKYTEAEDEVKQNKCKDPNRFEALNDQINTVSKSFKLTQNLKSTKHNQNDQSSMGQLILSFVILVQSVPDERDVCKCI
jgi:hypothetical protein